MIAPILLAGRDIALPIQDNGRLTILNSDGIYPPSQRSRRG
jgi:hypothetical protein